PGKCAAVPSASLSTCVDTQAQCGVCRTLNGADGLASRCHVFADGVAVDYCGDRPATAQSIARQWDEMLLDAIRRDTPRPTTHARNLFHLSVLMWDVWRSYGGGGTAWLTDEPHASADPARDRDIAVSFAAYRLIASRFQHSNGRLATMAEIQARMLD